MEYGEDAAHRYVMLNVHKDVHDPLFARLALTSEQEDKIPYLLLYILTADEGRTYGERKHLQLLIGTVLNREILAIRSSWDVAMTFLDVSAQVCGAHPRRLFSSQVFVQTCLALITDFRPVRWVQLHDKDGLALTNLFTSTMDYNFPQNEMRRIASGPGDKALVAAYLLAYNYESDVDDMINHPTYRHRAALDKLGLTKALRKRHALNIFITKACDAVRGTKRKYETRGDLHVNLQLVADFEECARAVKKARTEEA